MLIRVDERSHLRAADDHLRLAVFLLSAQEDRIARERAAGLDTQLSGELLFIMQAILRSFIVTVRRFSMPSTTNAGHPSPAQTGFAAKTAPSWIGITLAYMAGIR
jgi:hypothetical protein